MMNNLTTGVHMTKSFFHQHLLGESLKSIFIRLTIILLATIIIWCFMMVILILYIRHQRRKHMQHLLESHHHLFDTKLKLTNNRSNNLKYLFSPIINENSLPSKLPLNTNKIHSVIKAMTKSPLISTHQTIIAKKNSSQYRKTKSLNDNEFKTLHLTDTYSLKQNQNIIDPTPIKEPKTFTRHNFSLEDNNDVYQSKYYSQGFNPITRWFSNITLNTIQNRSLFLNSPRHNLPSTKPRYAVSNDHLTNTDNCIRNLPLVMITNTNALYTSIIELETFQDKHRVITDVEKRLMCHLRASM